MTTSMESTTQVMKSMAPDRFFDKLMKMVENGQKSISIGLLDSEKADLKVRRVRFADEKIIAKINAAVSSNNIQEAMSIFLINVSTGNAVIEEKAIDGKVLAIMSHKIASKMANGDIKRLNKQGQAKPYEQVQEAKDEEFSKLAHEVSTSLKIPLTENASDPLPTQEKEAQKAQAQHQPETKAEVSPVEKEKPKAPAPLPHPEMQEKPKNEKPKNEEPKKAEAPPVEKEKPKDPAPLTPPTSEKMAEPKQTEPQAAGPAEVHTEEKHKEEKWKAAPEEKKQSSAKKPVAAPDVPLPKAEPITEVAKEPKAARKAPMPHSEPKEQEKGATEAPSSGSLELADAEQESEPAKKEAP